MGSAAYDVIRKWLGNRALTRQLGNRAPHTDVPYYWYTLRKKRGDLPKQAQTTTASPEEQQQETPDRGDLHQTFYG